SAGTYNVGLRVQDSEGRWSNSIQRRFTIFASSLVTATEIEVAESSLDYDQAEVNQAWLLSLGGAITDDSYTLSINGETITVNTRYAETRYGLLNRILSAINGNPFINASYIAELVGSTQIKIQALSLGNQSSSTIAVSENIDVSVVATGNIGSQGRKLIAAEYFINDDPGPGSATPLATFADSDKYALRTQEAAIDMASLRAGSHRVGIRFKNQAGRWSQPLYHSVNIFSLFGDADTTAPVISLTGGASVSIPYQGTYAEVGFTAIDDIDGDLSSAVVIEGQIDSNRPGDQFLNYKITDTAGNLATATRTVTVVDSQAPTISGTSEASYLEPPAIIDLYDGLVVSDPEFGDLTYALKIKTSNVDWFTAGNYYVTFEVEDPAGNSDEFTRNYFLSAGAIAYPSYQAWIDGRGDPLGITLADRLPGADPDGDFVINEDEWYADTDPFDKFSLLTMDTVRNDNQLLLHWSGLMRNQYWIESSHDLTLWESYTEKYTIDGGAYFELGVDFASPDQPKSFYRLATEPRLPIDD
ncbi:MAG: DUF5011 domain-containing protein, partial [Verrucomicrobiota bacterium]|nr:DUF5011 domain-containing protein [Verrucomicrobiota bacterium]